MIITADQVQYGEIQEPFVYKEPKVPVMLTDETMQARKQKVLAQMKKWNYDALLIYADREHGDNFAYLTGFSPRFEEAVLVLHRDGKGYLMLGNEMLSMNEHCRMDTAAVHVPYFSLPNQPMNNSRRLSELFEDAGIVSGMKVGIAGWKMFTSSLEDNSELLDVPYFIVRALKETLGDGRIQNAAGLFIDPEDGARTVNTANEIAYFEFGAALASDCVMNCINRVETGVTEMELASELAAYGQPVSVQTICAAGERFTNAVVEPRNKKTVLGDRFSVTMGLRGGLTSRAGYVAEKSEDLPEEEQHYLEELAIPYFAALATWYSTVGLDVTAGEVYDAVDQVLPKEKYQWELNPGHLTGTEEWMSSPFWKGSDITLKSGMILQMDIIPRLSGLGKAGAEDGIVLADSRLRDQLRAEYPEVWNRMMVRRDYMEKELHIPLKEEILPLSDIAGYYRVFLLNQKNAMKVRVQNDNC